MALGSTQPVTEVNTRGTGLFPGGDKDGQRVGLTNLPPSHADCLEIWEPQLPGTLRACPGLYRDCFIILVYSIHIDER
jgi:hypothetical protein